MTRDEIKERVKENLYDSGMVNFDSESLDDSIQDGYDEIALLSGCVEKIATLGLVGNLTYYKVTDYVTNYFRPIAIWNNQTNRWLEPLSYKEIGELHGRWETVNGSVIAFTPIGFEYIAIFRKPATTSGTLLLFYKATADTLAGGTTPTIPSSDVNILEDYATADSLDQILEYEKSIRYFTDYQTKIKEIIRKLNSRNMSDRIMVMNEVVGMVK